MKKILVTPRGYGKYGQKQQEELEKLGFEMDVNHTGAPLTRETFVEKAKQSTGIIVGVDKLDKELLEQCPDLKVIVKFGVGTDNIDLEACKKLGITVERCVGTNSNAVAEFTIGLMFACARHIVSNAEKVKQRQWEKPTGVELFGKKIGILGFGSIGKNVARIAYGLGMSVAVYDVFDIPTEELMKYRATQCSFEQIITECDFISIHVPLTEETRNLISTEEFKQMKPNSVLVNAARGGIVDESALFEALKNKDISAAASDVFTSEPPVDESWVNELLTMDNFLLTAHIASRSEEAEMKTVDLATRLLKKNLLSS